MLCISLRSVFHDVFSWHFKIKALWWFLTGISDVVTGKWWHNEHWTPSQEGAESRSDKSDRAWLCLSQEQHVLTAAGWNKSMKSLNSHFCSWHSLLWIKARIKRTLMKERIWNPRVSFQVYPMSRCICALPGSGTDNLHKNGPKIPNFTTLCKFFCYRESWEQALGVNSPHFNKARAGKWIP